jgi:hypothetical protein
MRILYWTNRFAFTSIRCTEATSTLSNKDLYNASRPQFNGQNRTRQKLPSSIQLTTNYPLSLSDAIKANYYKPFDSVLETLTSKHFTLGVKCCSFYV